MMILLAFATAKIKTDVIVLSKNAAVQIPVLARMFECSHWVIDATNSSARTVMWKRECEQLHLSAWAVVEKGAFVMTMDWCSFAAFRIPATYKPAILPNNKHDQKNQVRISLCLLQRRFRAPYKKTA